MTLPAESFMFASRLVVFLALLYSPMLAAAGTILIYGDSLSAGYGIRQDESWPALLSGRLREQGFDYKVVNASISGETTAGGRARLEAALKQHRPAMVILALGANDGLRGLDTALMSDNIEAMIRTARLHKADAILIGMRLPPNYGKAYTEKFHQTYLDLAKRLRVPLLPFLLEEFAGNMTLFQSDGLHPTAAAQPMMLDAVWKVLRTRLHKPAARSTSARSP